ncbi:transcriptional initiation protein Tat, partial [Paenibacillus sp. TAF58]
MKLSRRDFLLKGTAMFATLGLGGALFTETGKSIFAGGFEDDVDLGVDEPVLVVVQLSGGNDGINTLIPYGQGIYYDARPTLSYQQKDVLALDNQVGLHPSLVG